LDYSNPAKNKSQILNKMQIYEGKEQIANLPRPNSSRPAYFVGLDLGQSADFSAIAVMERHGTTKDNYVFHCRHLERWKLRTSYPAIVADTVRMMNSSQMQSGRTRPMLAVDATGVGAPVIDLFKRERINARLEPIQITGGSEITKENHVTRVPKRDLVSTVQVYLQNGRLKIAEQLPEAETLTRELQNFQVKISDNAHDSYGAWREGTHDDLVLAASLALWAATGITVGTFYSM
jgi:hypothetical protein